MTLAPHQMHTNGSALAQPAGNPPPAAVDLAEWVAAARDATVLANGLADSHFVPAAYRQGSNREITVANATGAILLGRSLGVDPLTALQQIYVIKGRPGMYSKFKVALATAAGCEIWVEESTDESVTVCGTAKGSARVHTVTITMDMAKKAGWLTNDNFVKTPQDMLYARASGRIADRVAPHILFGIQSIEDLQDAPEPETVATFVKVTAADILARTPSASSDEAKAIEAAVQTPAGDESGEARGTITKAQLTKLQTMYTRLGIKERDRKLAVAVAVVRRPLTSSTELMKDEAVGLIDHLEAAASSADPDAAVRFLLGEQPAAVSDNYADDDYLPMDGAEAVAEGN